MRKYIDTAEIGRRFGRNPHTIRDWILFGCPTPAGKVKLRATKFGKKWMVKDEDLELFEHRVRSQSERPDLDLEGREGQSPSPKAKKGQE
jgi:hypothetical protein